MAGADKLLDDILYPSAEYTPIPFWFFNDVPDRQKIKSQMEDYVQKGVHGIVLHPRIGVPEEIPYLSEKFFEIVRFVVEIASQLDMKIVLYDEGMYPSGSAHGMVAAQNPEYASRGITLSEQPGAGTVVARLNDGTYIVNRFTGGTIRGIHFGEDDREKGAPLSANILNPEAVKLFIQLTHERYYEELKEFFGNTIIGFFTDEPCALGRNAAGFFEWTDGMEQEIIENGGVLEDLSGLFFGCENLTTAIYRRLIKKHLRETFYAALSIWCTQHGVQLMGHPAESDDVEEELYFHTPGQDLIMRRVEPKMGGVLEPDSVQAKLTADIARHLGRRRNSNECFGVCSREGIPWYFTGEDMKWYIDWLGIRGINLFIPHAFYYSVDGKRKEERPPDVGPHNIWWKHYRMFSDYMKRISFLMTDSVNTAAIAVLCDNNQVPYDEIACLYENQIEFNYLPIALLSECSIENRQLCMGEYRYDIVLNLIVEQSALELPGMTVLHSLEELFDGGITAAVHNLRAVVTDHYCKDLRATHLVKYNTDMYLLSNEGKERINTTVILSGNAAPTIVDLWEGRYNNSIVSIKEKQVKLGINLKPCETLLIIMAETKKTVNYEVQNQKFVDWTSKFTLLKKSENRAFYEYTYNRQSIDNLDVFEVLGEEMAECYCNGHFTGVSFWNPHQFKIASFLKDGENKIEVIMTGNAANIYSNAGVFFGLKDTK